jgi:hypothetical protein
MSFLIRGKAILMESPEALSVTTKKEEVQMQARCWLLDQKTLEMCSPPQWPKALVNLNSFLNSDNKLAEMQKKGPKIAEVELMVTDLVLDQRLLRLKLLFHHQQVDFSWS